VPCAQIHRDEGLLKAGQHRQGLPLGVKGQAVAVENELVIAPHLVEIDKGRLRIFGRGPA
jgi:hypothetical protein